MNGAEGNPKLRWFRSSYSSGPDGNSCVEAAVEPGTVHVRDSKQSDGPRLSLSAAAWTAFVVHQGRRRKGD
ncbi:DUF397 domain-containing protein [Streptomyces chilikensis]|uniref:DUF397 domain-containing protein n=1 Tax=Streptomyces chilikensis TaxID=1194079 RepID=UPI000B005E65|nr:DUF397 domain-containing protein [Streptomyces chilikensis]